MCLQKIKHNKIGIAGAGAFGTALAISYSKFNSVVLFSAFKDHVESLQKSGKNEFCEDFIIPEEVSFDILENIRKHNFDYIFWSFPVKPSIQLLESIKIYLKTSVPIIICSKGLTQNNGFLVDEFIKILGEDFKVGFLSGPNFAVDIASYKFSSADIGFLDEKTAKICTKELSNENFKLFACKDVIGMQISSAVKNVVAIACGIMHGLSFGQNALAYCLTAGLKEMSALGIALGADINTFYGLSGLGDLVLTASSTTSRNMTFGTRLASGEKIEDILSSGNSVCEGTGTVKQIIEIAKKFNIDLPICKAVYEILCNGAPASSIVNVL